MENKRKVGLCLTGGGGKGAYQIGAVQALEDLGLYQEIEAYSGTSIGSANAAVLVSDSIEAAKNVWFTMPENALDLQKPLREQLREKRLKVLDKGIYTMRIFEERMLENLDHKKLSESTFFVTISELGDEGRGIFELFSSTFDHYIRKNVKAHYVAMHDIEEEIRMDVIKASCSIPVAFPAVTINHKNYYDGGVFDNTPVSPLIEDGCTVIYIIDIGFVRQPVSVHKKYPNIEFHVIKPKSSIGGVLDFTVEHSREIYQRGYDDTINYFKNKKVDSK